MSDNRTRDMSDNTAFLCFLSHELHMSDNRAFLCFPSLQLRSHEIHSRSRGIYNIESSALN